MLRNLLLFILMLLSASLYGNDRLPTDMQVYLNQNVAVDSEKDRIQKVVKDFYDDYMEHQVEVIGSGFLRPYPLGADGSPDVMGDKTLSMGEPLTLPQFLHRHPRIVLPFTDKINKMLLAAENDGYPEMGIDHDPILMAQDIPKALQIEDIAITHIISGDAARIKMHQIWGNDTDEDDDPSHYFSILLRESGDYWMIADISSH